MKRAFIRALWGQDDGDRYFGKRRTKMEADLQLIKLNPYSVPFTCYTFGKHNHNFMLKNGIESKIICPYPYNHEYKKNGWHQYAMKLYAMQAALEDYDEVILLDFDTVACKKLPPDLWDTLSKRKPLQAILRGYKLKKIHWREVDRRKRVCASFIYCRDKVYIDNAIKFWEGERIRSEEDALSWAIDDMEGGWKGLDHYWDNYEPMFFDLFEEAYRIYPPDYIKQKDVVFKHFNKVHRRQRIKKLKRKGYGKRIQTETSK